MTWSAVINGGHSSDKAEETRALLELQKCAKEIEASGAGVNTTHHGFVDLLSVELDTSDE